MVVKLKFNYAGLTIKADSYTRICKWLGIKADDFLKLQKRRKCSDVEACLHFLNKFERLPPPCSGVVIDGLPSSFVINRSKKTKPKERSRWSTNTVGAVVPNVDPKLQPRVSQRKNHRGHHVYTDYVCPVCSYDEFVSDGLCSGVFTIRTSDLLDGKRSCRCSISYRYTEKQRLHQVNQKCEKMGFKLLSHVGSDKHNAKNFTLTLQCDKGHTWQSNIDRLVYKDCCCPTCAGHDQEYGYINIVKDQETPVALKFGITKVLKRRLRTQNNRNVLNMEQLDAFQFPNSQACKDAEQECKQVLNCAIVSKSDMTDGHTETVALTDYDKVVSIYERFGGVRVDTLTEEDV